MMKLIIAFKLMNMHIPCYSICALVFVLIKSLVKEALAVTSTSSFPNANTDGEFPTMDKDCLQMDFNLFHYF